MAIEDEKEATEEKQPEQTPKETVEALQAKLQTMEQELNKRNEDVRGLNKTLQQRAEEIKKRADLEGRIEGLQDTVELLATAIAFKREPDSLETGERQDILADLKKRKTEQEAKAKQKELAETQQEYAQKADALYTRAKAIFADDDDAIERIEDLLGNGRLERAEARVMKAEKSKETPKKSGETEEQRVERLAQEKFQKHLEEKGLLDTYSSAPSGTGGSSQEAMSQYIAGKITAEEATKRGVKFN